jgi:hypothetical protein
MDYWGALRDLQMELQRVDQVIHNLEMLAAGNAAPVMNRRGRKNMSPAERKLVSERMRTYWASRRNRENAVSS